MELPFGFGNGQVDRDTPGLMCMGPGVVIRLRKIVRQIARGEPG